MVQTADFDYKDFDSNAQKAGDASLLVKFFLKTVQDKTQTAKEGRPMFKEVEYIDIKIPGSRGGGACRPVRQKDLDRFPEHYSMFKNRIEAPVSGTPLAEWLLMSRSQAEELAFHNVKTVEQLAEMSDTHVGKFMGLNTMKAKAKEWLKAAKDAAPAAELQAAIAEKDVQIASLIERLNALEGSATGAEIVNNPSIQPSTLDITAGLDDTPDSESEPEPEPDKKPVATKKAPRKRRKRKAVSDG